MATITQNANGYSITAAHRIVAHMTLSAFPKGATYTIVFEKAKASPNKVMSGSLTRDLPGGGVQSNSIPISAVTMNEVVVPLGVFTGRRVAYTVADNAGAGTRTLTVKIRSLDGTGVNEVWHHNLSIIQGPADLSDFDLSAAGAATIDSVDVTP